MRQRSGRRWLLALALTAGVGLAPPAWSQPLWKAEDFQQTGFYLTGMATFGIPTEADNLEDDVEDSFASAGADAQDVVYGLDARAGYRLHKRVALEGQFEWIRELQVESRSGGMKREDEITLFTLTGNAKGYLLTGRVQPYGILGAGWMRSRLNPDGTGAKSRDDGFVLRTGAGADLYANPRVALSLEAAYVITPTGGIEDLDYVSLSAGLTLRFYGVTY